MAEVTTTARDNLRDIVVEAVNAKDPDLFSLADEVDIPSSFVESVVDVMERWPQMVLSRGQIGAEPVAAVWLPNEEGRYALVEYLEFDIENGSARMEIVDDVHADLVTEPPAALEVAEWENADAGGEGWVV